MQETKRLSLECILPYFGRDSIYGRTYYEERVEPLISYVPRIKVKGQPTADNGIMTQHKTSCLAAVLVSFCIMFMAGGTNGCTGEPTCMFCLNYWVVGILSR